MLRRRANPGLSRKVVAYYLLFCLAAVCWLAVGTVIASHAASERRTESICQARLASAAAMLEMQLLRQDFAGRDPLLAEIRNACQAESCSIVGRDGKLLAHTSPDRVGQPADEPLGRRERIGGATRVEYADASGRALTDYRTELTLGSQRVGELRVTLARRNLWSTMHTLAQAAPLTVLAPLAFIAAGAWRLWRLTHSLSEAEARLQNIARQPWGADPEVASMRARDAASIGWNRLVDHVHALARQAARGSLDEALESAAQARNDARFEEVLERLSDGVAVTNAAGRIEFANQAVAALLGHDDDASDLSGAVLEERLLHAAEDPKTQEMLSPVTRSRTAVCELVRQSPQAERVLRVARLPLGADAARGHVWSLRDVTQQKLAEQTRDRFIDTATHELRTPLANIKAYAETLATAESIDVELQKEFCNIINSEVTRLARFIDDLLSISSMEVGALSIDRQKVETERMFAEVLSKVEPLMHKKSIKFETSLPPKMPELALDKDKIVAVVVNVLGNAAKYTPQGGRVSLKVKCEEGWLRIAVQDTGVGIAADELPKVFDKFFRSDDPRVQAETGSGLGLSLAREVVRMHGGEVTAESELNQGSTFTVSLPLA